MALKYAIQLGIPDAIQKHGKAMTLDELANSLLVQPNKAPCLRQLMRLLVHSDFYSTKTLDNSGEKAFDLTLSSQLLLKDHPLTQVPFALLEMDPIITEPSHHFGVWFQGEDESPFHIAQGRHLYERMPCVSKFNDFFNQAMASDARLVSTLLVTNNEFKGLIEGIESLVDVGGGDGTLAKAIAKAYPMMNCIVFDLSHVVDGLQGNGRNLTYVAGDMFEAIFRAHVIILKWIMHNWSDDNCIKILKRCKESIPSKDEGGKLLIIEMVVGISSDNVNHSQSQFLMDMQMVSVLGGKRKN